MKCYHIHCKGGIQMNYVTLGQLSNFMWYIQRFQVKDDKGNILFDGVNSELQSVVYADIRNRWVRGFGSIDDVLIVTII